MSIKRDQNLFSTLKDEKVNNNWHRSFEVQAGAQDVNDVLNPAYVPRTQEDKDLFAEKQKFMFAVLEAKVLTSKGKSIIRDHLSSNDAQTVYKLIKEHHEKSTRALMEASELSLTSCAPACTSKDLCQLLLTFSSFKVENRFWSLLMDFLNIAAGE